MIQFASGEAAGGGPPQRDFDSSRFDNLGDDDDDETNKAMGGKPNKQMQEQMKNMQAMMEGMTKGKSKPGGAGAAPRAAQRPTKTLAECIPAELRGQLRQLTPDGGCLYRVLEAAPSGERPRPRAKCNFEWVAHYIEPRVAVDPQQPGWRECPGGGIRLGKQFKVLGWELGASAMQVGETAEIYCAPKYCEGFCDIQMTLLRLEHAAGCPGGMGRLTGCPACNPELTAKQVEFQNSGQLARRGEPIVFTLRLTSVEQFDVTRAEFWELDVESRLAAAEAWRVEGNTLIGKKDYRAAVDKYHKAVSYLETMLDHVEGPAADETPENKATAGKLRLLKIPLHLNRALGLLKLNDFVEAGRSCEKVLEDEPDNIKALFRLGQAFAGLHEYASAEQHFDRCSARALAAGSADVAASARKQKEAMRKVRAKAAAKDKKLAAKMFAFPPAPAPPAPAQAADGASPEEGGVAGSSGTEASGATQRSKQQGGALACGGCEEEDCGTATTGAFPDNR